MENINKIQIVPDEVYEIGADKVPVIPEWSVKDDETLRKKVDDLAHSTFDRSKFTVVGSPTISANGVFTGTPSNYLMANVSQLASATKYTIKIEYTPNVIDNWGWILCPENISGVGMLQEGSTIKLQNKSANISSNLNLTLNTKTVLEAIIDGSSYTFKATINGVEQSTSGTYANLSFTDGYIDIGDYADNPSTGYAKGSIDLKQFSITVDGIEVFSGNKTGIDTIKPNDYTEVGTPTISADGVIISADASNYIQKSISFSGNTLTYEGQFYLEPDNTLSANTNRAIFNIGKFGMGIRYQQSNEKYMFAFGEETNWSNNNGSNQSNIYFTEKGLYKYKISINLSTGVITLTYTNPDGTVIAPFTVTYMNNAGVATSVSTATVVQICKGADYSFVKDIDLNTIKFYVDGNLVYQPLLRIPYTEGQNYAKVVDKLYRDRVKDLFEQKGYNIYYTLGENDFTLPSNKPNEIVKYKANGLTVAEQRADQTLTIRGACEQGVDVNLPMEFFSDDSYAVFGVGTTGTNTASKFTPAADGNYIAIGKGKV